MFRSILVFSLSLILLSGCATLNQKNGATDLDAAPEPAPVSYTHLTLPTTPYV